VSPDLEKEITFELQGMERTVRQFRIIINRIDQTTSEYSEIIALAALFHAFYSGAENIFKRIALHPIAAGKRNGKVCFLV
jgi:hypothetical protein